jgi:hypothetical protein
LLSEITALLAMMDVIERFSQNTCQTQSAITIAFQQVIRHPLRTLLADAWKAT